MRAFRFRLLAFANLFTAKGAFHLRFPDDNLKCVAFIGLYDEIVSAKAFRATAWFLQMPFKTSTKQSFMYLVTARHVAEHASTQRLGLRINLKGGGSQVLDISGSAWTFHADPSVDVAVVECINLGPEYDFVHVPADLLATNDLLQKKNLGLGSDICTIGLLAYHSGNSRNLPILRFGHIAMMNHEPVESATGQIDAFIAEGRSIGGLSGSPVFVMTDGIGARESYLLGLVHGHWDVPLHGGGNGGTQGAAADMFQRANAGLSIIVPAEKILETLDHPNLVAHRADVERRHSIHDIP